MLIGREEYSYFINCTAAVQLMIFSKQKNGGQAEFKPKRNCSRENKIAIENTNKAPNFG